MYYLWSTTVLTNEMGAVIQSLLVVIQSLLVENVTIIDETVFI